MANARHFLGVVGMLNSLRLVGHREPVYLLDCGLTAPQRELLSPHVSIVAAPRDAPPPYVLKTIAPLADPAEVMVLIDADMIVTRPLGELIDEARSGKVLAFRAGYERFFSQWGELLGLGPVTRRPYICSGLALLGGDEGRAVLRLMDAGQKQLSPRTGQPHDPRRFFEAVGDSPFQLADQDVLNAVLCSRPDPRLQVALDHALAPDPPFPGLRVTDDDRLRCEAENGPEPYVLHHLGAKPWLVPMAESPYSRLLTRLLVGPAIEVPEGDVPVRLRRGLLARPARRLAGLQGRMRSIADSASWRISWVAALRNRRTHAARPG